jgi:peptide deformylase
MINPEIIERSKDTITGKSNCGSLCLKEKVKVRRYRKVTAVWYDISGNKRQRVFDSKKGGGTIQHEIDHNNGILITD